MGSRRGRSSQRRPPAGSIRGVVTDVDGTLTDRDRRLNLGAVDVVRRLDRSGIPVVLATGNVLPIALALHRSIGLTAPIVAENGGILYYRQDGQDRVERLTDRRPAWAAFHRLRRARLPVRRLFTDRWRETEVALEPNVPLVTLRRALRSAPVTVEPTGFAVHLMERGGGKLRALEIALRRIGLSPSDCLIAGDGDNDVGMLGAAGWAVSFSTASARARSAADYVARAPYAEGFVEALMVSGAVPAMSPAQRRT